VTTIAEEVQACRDGERAVLVTYRCAGTRRGRPCATEMAHVYGSALGPLFVATWTEPAIGGAEGWRNPPWRVRQALPAMTTFFDAHNMRIPDVVHVCAELVADEGELRMKCRHHPMAIGDRGTLHEAMNAGTRTVWLVA
jgi:hypothetical protein